MCIEDYLPDSSENQGFGPASLDRSNCTKTHWHGDTMEASKWVRTFLKTNGLISKMMVCGITFLELLANFLLVTGKTIPVTIKRLGTRITWAPFNSEQAYIQPQRARSAMAQAVVLDSIIQQLNRIFNMAIFPMPKRIGIKSLSHFGHCTLQKRTGYVCRPELKHTKETIFLVNAFLNDCRDNQNYNLSMRVSSYFKTPPVPICMSLQNPATVITPEQVIYRRNKLYGRRRKGQWQHCLQQFICGVWRYFLVSIYFDFFRWALDIWRHFFGHSGWSSLTIYRYEVV